MTISLLSSQSIAEDETSKGFFPNFQFHSKTIRQKPFSLPQSDLHFPHEHTSEHHRTKRNVFFDMIDDLTEDDDDDDGSEEEEEEETISESIETTTTRFGRFISPLAFSKISETLGNWKFISLFKILFIRSLQQLQSFGFGGFSSAFNSCRIKGNKK